MLYSVSCVDGGDKKTKSSTKNVFYESLRKQINSSMPVAVLSDDDTLRLLLAAPRRHHHAVMLISALPQPGEVQRQCAVCGIIEKEYLLLADAYLKSINGTGGGGEDVAFILADIQKNRGLAGYLYTSFNIPVEKFPIMIYFRPQMKAYDGDDMSKVPAYLDLKADRETYAPAHYLMSSMNNDTFDLSENMAKWLETASRGKVDVKQYIMREPETQHPLLLRITVIMLGIAVIGIVVYIGYYARRTVMVVTTQIREHGVLGTLAPHSSKIVLTLILIVYYLAITGTMYDIINGNILFRRMMFTRTVMWVNNSLNGQYIAEAKVAGGSILTIALAFYLSTKLGRFNDDDDEEDEGEAGEGDASMAERMMAIVQSMDDNKKYRLRIWRSRMFLWMLLIIIIFCWWVLTMLLRAKMDSYPLSFGI